MQNNVNIWLILLYGNKNTFKKCNIITTKTNVIYKKIILNHPVYHIMQKVIKNIRDIPNKWMNFSKVKKNDKKSTKKVSFHDKSKCAGSEYPNLYKLWRKMVKSSKKMAAQRKMVKRKDMRMVNISWKFKNSF